MPRPGLKFEPDQRFYIIYLIGRWTSAESLRVTPDGGLACRGRGRDVPALVLNSLGAGCVATAQRRKTPAAGPAGVSEQSAQAADYFREILISPDSSSWITRFRLSISSPLSTRDFENESARRNGPPFGL